MLRRHCQRPMLQWVETWCGMSNLRSDTLTHELDEVDCPECRAAMIESWICPECGHDGLVWGASVAVGEKLYFHLGCERCSATLVSSVNTADVAAALTTRRWSGR